MRPTTILLLLVLTGCGSSPPTNFYVLAPTSEAGEAVTSSTEIGVGPITLPTYLDRPGMVTRKSATDLNVSDFHQWAEPLDENFARVLRENLSALLGTERVMTYPWDGGVDASVEVTVERFDAGRGTAHLDARWTVNKLVGKERVLIARRSDLSAPAAEGDHSALAKGLSETLAALSREIAAAINGEPKAP